jgi:hypothetical protein
VAKPAAWQLRLCTISPNKTGRGWPYTSTPPYVAMMMRITNREQLLTRECATSISCCSGLVGDTGAGWKGDCWVGRAACKTRRDGAVRHESVSLDCRALDRLTSVSADIYCCCPERPGRNCCGSNGWISIRWPWYGLLLLVLLLAVSVGLVNSVAADVDRCYIDRLGKDCCCSR